MLVSIIIPALNEQEFIGKCLSSLVDQKFSRDLYEVVLIDNGSTDKTLEIFNSYSNELNLQSYIVPDVNVSKLRNIGVKKAKGQNLAFLDADCSVPNNWLTLGLKYINKDDNGIVAAGASCSVPESATWVAKTWDKVNTKRRIRGKVKVLPTGGLFVLKDAFEEIGGFNSDLITNEDFDLSYRLRKNGYKLYSDPELSVTHWGVPNTILDFLKREIWHGTHVFRVFMNDIKSMRNIKAIAYAFYYLLNLLFLCVTLFVSFFYKDSILLWTLFVIGFFFPPFILSWLVLKNRKWEFSEMMQLYVILLCYGIARALSMTNMRLWRIL